MKPLLKWAGGKRHIVSILEELLPADWKSGTYFEPFLGGAAFFLYLAPPRSILADVNPRLVGFYNDVQDRPNKLYRLIENYAKEFNASEESAKKDYYLQLRGNFNLAESGVESSAMLYALNKLCFNGLYRENSRGHFNVPFGQKKNFPTIHEADFESVSQAFGQSAIQLADFENTVSRAMRGDFVYFDPPYIPISPTSSFTTYSSVGFGVEEQRRLAATMHELRSRGVKAMLSNSSTEVTSHTYAGLRQVTISAPRMVSASASGRGRVDELVIMNY